MSIRAGITSQQQNLGPLQKKTKQNPLALVIPFDCVLCDIAQYFKKS
jgi:hypothetical protein